MSKARSLKPFAFGISLGLQHPERLLPGTDALPRSTLEMVEYRSQWLVRIRHATA